MQELLELFGRLLDLHPGLATLFGIGLLCGIVTQMKLMLDVNWMRKNTVNKDSLTATLEAFKSSIKEDVMEYRAHIAETYTTKEEFLNWKVRHR